MIFEIGVVAVSSIKYCFWSIDASVARSYWNVMVDLYYCLFILFFFRNGKLIEENEKYVLRGSNTQLTIRDIKNIDAGPYICNAKNKAGNDKKQTFLQVFGKYCIVWSIFPFKM